jgi:tryptophanyl-tRNA synthetase
MSKKRILSGMRPTGKLHLGNLVGALNTWVKLQDEYECFYMVADWHALTSDYADTSELETNIIEMVIDWLSCGIDPQKSVIFRQSHVIEHAELFLLLSMIIPLSWLERCPTYKEQITEVKDKDLSTYGFLGYPVLQAADIIIYKADTVPVGEDQLPHLELTREIVRRFNNFYSYEGRKIFIEPQAYLSIAPRLPGIDGRKMSKSYNNYILISDNSELISQKVYQMYTDPQKIRVTDKGHPEGCVVFAFNSVYCDNYSEIKSDCYNGKIGCVECKKNLSKKINEILNPIRLKREEIIKNKDIITDILDKGQKKASEIAKKTMEEVRSAIKIK